MRIHLKKENVAANDGNFEKYANGVVKDTKTGLEWVVGPDKDTNWDEARAWVQSVSIAGGGWRMSTVDELKALYDKGKGDCNMTPLLKTAGWYVWSGETEGSLAAWFFDFKRRRRVWNLCEGSYTKTGLLRCAPVDTVK